MPCSFSLSVHFILYTSSLIPQRQPHARAVIHSLIAFHSTHFTFRVYVFSRPTNPCGCSRVPFHSTPLHHRTHTPFSFIRFDTLHSLITSSPCLFQRTVRAKKMRQTSCRQHPSTALRASCVRGTRSTRSGSHTNAQAEYYVPFFYTRISALLSTLAQGCFYYSV